VKIESQKMGTVEVRGPVGPLVDEDAAEFVDVLLGLLDAVQPRVVVSMKEVPYMDSVALEGLLDAADKMRERNQNLKLASLTPTCREILGLTGLTGHFQTFENVPDAVRSFM
jgi:anti-anti-sigma factor